MESALALAVLLLAAPCRAGKPEPVGQRTFWDELMEHQTRKSLHAGAQLMAASQYEAAAKEFAKAVIASPNDPEAHRMLGVAYYWSGNVAQAESEFRESLRLDAQSPQGHLLLGIVQAWKGEMDAAYASFQAGAKLDGERADLQMNLGSIEESRGDFQPALAHFRRAAELDPQNPLYHFQLGMLYGKLGRYEESVPALQRAIKLFPGYEDALLELGAVYERMETANTKEARACFEKAVKLKDRDAVARLRLGRVYLTMGDSAKAAAVLRDVFHLTPADRGGGLALSVAYGGRGGDGAPEGKDATPEEPAPGASSGPLDLVRRNVSRIPLDQDAVLNVDVAFITRPKLVRRQARETPSSLKKELERAGKVPSGGTLGVRKTYELKAGSREERLAEIRRILADLKGALDSAPPDSETRIGMNLSFSDRPSSAGGGKPADAKVSYQPRDVGNDMGLWVMGTGWMALVEEVLTPAGEKMPHEGSVGWWLLEGIGHATLGRARPAAEAFAAALKLDPRSELATLGLGVARVISGDEEGAAEAYRRALEINPKNKTAEEGLKWLMTEPTVAAP